MAWKPASLDAMVNALLRHIAVEDLRDALDEMGLKERHEAERRFVNIRGAEDVKPPDRPSRPARR